MSNPLRHAAGQAYLRLYLDTARIRRRLTRIPAKIYRRLLGHITFIGITGSFGKSTTTALIHAVLKSHGRVKTSRPEEYNSPITISKYLLATNPLTRFCAFEVSGSMPGQLANIARILRPDIGVVTHVSFDHYSAFRDIERIADGKADLVRSLPPSGVAVLNKDDPRVAGMAKCTNARVITVGLSEHATWRAENISSSWPDQLSFELLHEGRRRRICTRLNGEQWIYPVLSAIAVAHVVGVPVDDAIEIVSRMENIAGRMNAIVTDDGVTYIDDSYKCPYYAAPVTIDWLKQARAPRKVVVLGTLADYPGSASSKYRDIARQALDAADTVLFVGKQSRMVRKAVPEDDPSRLQMFTTAFEARRYLRGYLRDGDLVLIKASGTADHLERLALDHLSPVTCWRQGCRILKSCRTCGKRHDTVLPD